jgi:D-alanyl-D-alanine carboxypeptidase
MNADAGLPPASTLKIVTALVIVQVLDLDEQVTVEDGDLLDPTVFSTMGLQAGDVVTVRDLLYGLLMPSGGDAARALARVAGLKLDPSTQDPVARFVQEMNTYAQTLGMTSSHFSNPVGIDDPANNYASARDLVRAAQAVLNNWLLTQIVGTEATTVSVGGPNARQIELVTSNQLLSRDDVFGVKTGSEDIAGQCLIAGFWRGDNQIITVVLGSEDRYADTQSIMDAVDGAYRWLALGVGATSQGATDALAAQGLAFKMRRIVLMSAEQAAQVTWELVLDDDPGTVWNGVVVFRLGQREIARIPVYSMTGASVGLEVLAAA